ncbi:MAG: hypothetical protein ACI822_002812, partial [Gammaproteobacteria bacterium]
DIFISLIAFKKQFLIVFFVLLISGVLVVGNFYKEKHSLQSLVEIDEVSILGVLTQVKSPAAIVQEIKLKNMPALQGDSNFSDIETLIKKTRISNPKGTNIVEIYSKTTLPDKDLVGKFHAQLVSTITDDLKEAIVTTQNTIKPVLLINLEKIQEFKVEELRLEQSFRIRLESLSGNNNFSDEYVKSARNEIKLQQSLFQEQIKALQLKNEILESVMNNLGLRIVSSAVLSEDPVGITRNTLYFVVLVISVIFAFIAVIIISFSRKVKERLEANAGAQQ